MISNDDDDINEAVFTLEEVSDNDLRGSTPGSSSSTSWWSSHGTSHSKVQLCEANRQMVIENPPFKKFCFWNSGPVTIPYHDILAVEVGFGSSDRRHQQNLEMELNSKKYKVFDSALSISVCTIELMYILTEFLQFFMPKCARSNLLFIKFAGKFIFF